MLNIAIIGCGQIGSRHLQGLSRLNKKVTIYLIDSNEESIRTAKERFQDALEKDKRDNFYIKVREIKEIECDINFAIIATSSFSRAKITKELVLNNKVQYIVFEKFLFPKKSDYDEIQSLLEQKNIKSWVNQWMCFTDAFQQIIKWFLGDAKAEILVSGNGFGLGCNAVHFIDILDYISNREKDFSEIKANLDDNVVNSKREGYFEVHGEINILNGKNKLSIRSNNKKSDGILYFTFACGEKNVEAIFSEGSLKSSFYKSGKHVFNKNFVVPLQSQMSDKFILDIESSGQCDLPIYERSSIHHKIIIDILGDHIKRKSDWSGEGCPVT